MKKRKSTVKFKLQWISASDPPPPSNELGFSQFENFFLFGLSRTFGCLPSTPFKNDAMSLPFYRNCFQMMTSYYSSFLFSFCYNIQIFYQGNILFHLNHQPNNYLKYFSIPMTINDKMELGKCCLTVCT